MLDIRDRDPFAAGGHARARNIPFDELRARARAELPVDASIVIDCSRAETAKCRFAYDYLLERRFTDVAIYIP